MTYLTLKTELDNIQKTTEAPFPFRFTESLAFAHFKTVFEFSESPNYAILQGKNSQEYGTTEEMWYLTYTQDNQMVVLDISDEDTICDEFLQLIIAWLQGAQKIETRPRD